MSGAASHGRIRALVVRDNRAIASLDDVDSSALPEGDVCVAVRYSSLNYKDALAVTGAGKVVRRFPMVPGIDLAGIVETSASDQFKPGDAVVATGWGLGETHWGGYAERARLPADWLLPLPKELSLAQAMAIGTAGLTAALSLMELEARGLRPGGRPVLVTGAAGGVGSLAVALLAAEGYAVTASTGRRDVHEYLTLLGARDVVDRHTLTTGSLKALDVERWSGAIDVVGGETLTAIARSLEARATVAVCGLAGGHHLETTVYPFLLRGVALIGIATSTTPWVARRAAWDRLARALPRHRLQALMQTAGLDEVPRLSHELLKGHVRGRLVIAVSGPERPRP